MSTYLMHHGIKGMKWGVRRYQNEDGSLTDAGKARYGDKREYSDNVVRKILTGRIGGYTGGMNRGEFRSSVLADRSRRLNNKADIAAAKGKTAKEIKLRQRAKEVDRRKIAQDAQNSDREAYDRHLSTGKMLAQNLLMTGWGAETYRSARARGSTRGESLVKAMFGDWTGGKKEYGSATI